jgi:DNA-binding transcriptional LysR family regulator
VEPDEVDSLLDAGIVDVGFVYDYTLAPRPWRHPHTLMSSSTIVLAVPDHLDFDDRIRTPADLDPLRDMAWIGNSRDTGDDELSARLCALAGWVPHIGHRADSLEVVVDLVVAGQGVSVLPSDAVEAQRVRTVALDLADIRRRMWSTVRAGTQQWPANNAVIDHISAVIAGR